MQEIHSQVLSQTDFDANPIFATLGAMVGDTLDITRPDAPAPVDPAPAPAPVVNIGDTCTTDAGTPGTITDGGNGQLVCVANEAPAPAPVDGGQTVAPTAPASETITLTEGNACTTTDGLAGTLVKQGDALVCVPTSATA